MWDLSTGSLIVCLFVLAMTATPPSTVTALAPPDSLEPPAMTPAEQAQQGVGVQRSVRRLAASTPEDRKTVRILFYGQSITQPGWTDKVVADLKRRFPHAAIDARNLAIGGFASQNLSRVALHDVPAFYPDLVVFHVYGAHDKYEDILRLIRTWTTAEILIQTDHANRWPDRDAQPGDKRWWDHLMNDIYLPRYAKRYGTGLVDVRAMWVRYLKAHDLQPKALLQDNVHLNSQGFELMADLVSRYLEPRSELEAPAGEWVRTYVVGEDIHWEGGRLTLPFRGNRVDVLAAPAEEGKAARAEVRIDGKRPSEFPSMYVLTRPSRGHAGIWPSIKRVTSAAPLVPETWTITLSDINDAADGFSFRIEGSVTGPDGEGRLLPREAWPKDEQGRPVEPEPFVSDSGRIVIRPSDWNLAREREFRNKPVPEGFQITFNAVPLFKETYEAPAADEMEPNGENLVTLAQLLPNDEHTLELIGEGGRPVPIRAVRIYEPPLDPQASKEETVH